MASFHHDDDEILLDDDIGHESPIQRDNSLTFEQIEQLAEAREAGLMTSPSFSLAPTVEEQDVDLSDDDGPENNLVTIHGSVSFYNNNPNPRGFSDNPKPLISTPNQTPQYATVHEAHDSNPDDNISQFPPHADQPALSQSLSSTQPHPHDDDDTATQPNQPVNFKFTAQPTQTEGDILFDDDVDGSGGPSQSNHDSQPDTLQSTTSHFDFTNLKSLEAANAATTAQQSTQQHTLSSVLELIAQTPIDEDEDPHQEALPKRANPLSPTRTDHLSYQKAANSQDQPASDRTQPKRNSLPEIRSTSSSDQPKALKLALNTGSNIEFHQLSPKAVDGGKARSPSLSNAENRVRKEQYENPLHKHLISTSNNVTVDYNVLPPLSSLRLLRHDEQKQLERYADPYLQRPPCKDERLVRWFGRFGLYDPKGFYKWVVLVCVFLALLVVALPLSSSLYIRMFQLHFNITRTAASWFPSLQIGLFCIFNLLCPKFCDFFGPYSVLAVSLFLTLVSFLIPSLLNEYYSILIIHSFFVGIGSAGVQISSIYVLNDYFAIIPGDRPSSNILPPRQTPDRNDGKDQSNPRNSADSTSDPNQPTQAQADAVANGHEAQIAPNLAFVPTSTSLTTAFAIGFALSAFGIGNIIWGPFINYFLDKHIHYKEAFLWSGAIVFGLGLIILVLLRPRSHSLRLTRNFLRNELTYRVHLFLYAIPDELRYYVNNGKWEGMIGDLLDHSLATPMINFHLFKKPAFTMLFITAFLGAVMFYAPFIHLIPHAEDAGLTSGDTSLLMIIIGISSFAARIFFGFLCDKTHPFITVMISLILQLICAIVWYLSTNKGLFQFTSFLLGISAGSFVVGVSAINRQIHTSPTHLLSALGMIYGLAFLPAAIAVGPIMGLIREDYGSYDRFLIALIVIAALALVCGAAMFTMLKNQMSEDEMQEWQANKQKEAAEAEIQAHKAREEQEQEQIQQSSLIASAAPQPSQQTTVSPPLQPLNHSSPYKPQSTVFSFGQQAPPAGLTVKMPRPNSGNAHKAILDKNNGRLDERKVFAQYCQAILKTRSPRIDKKLSHQTFFVYKETIPDVATQYALALVRWRLSRSKLPGWPHQY